MSQFTGILYMVMKEVIEGNHSEVFKGNPFESPELIRSPFANHFVSGIVVREAVTFKPLPFPTLPALGAPPQVSPCSTKAAPAVAGGAGLRIKGSCKGKESC